MRQPNSTKQAVLANRPEAIKWYTIKSKIKRENYSSLGLGSEMPDTRGIVVGAFTQRGSGAEATEF